MTTTTSTTDPASSRKRLHVAYTCFVSQAKHKYRVYQSSMTYMIPSITHTIFLDQSKQRAVESPHRLVVGR